MPVMDGLELFDKLKAEFPHIQVIVLTCHSDFDYAREALRLGAIDGAGEFRVLWQILTQSRNALDNVEATLPSETIQAAIVIFASIPIIVVYPFLQKYFTKGMLLGAVKG